MRVFLTGLSYKTAPLDVRERLALPEASLAQALDALRLGPGVEEALILSTCNRVEIAVTTSPAATPSAITAFIVDSLVARHGLDRSWLEPHLYHLQDQDAVRHLFRVAASLDSMVLGEPQILGQLKAAYNAAKQHGAISGLLDSVLTRAFTVAKRVRSETDIGRSAVSISYAAIELAKQIFGDLRSKKVLLVGAGKMSELAARHLHRAGCAQILVTNRTRSRAVDLAALVGGQVIEYESFHARLPEIDIVLTSSGATEYLLKKEEMKQVLRKRQNRPIFLIDIAVPRNIDPAVNELENIYLYDIDDLGREVEANRLARQREAGQAEQIIEEEIQRLFERMKAREVAPTIVSLQQHLDELGRLEMERVRGKLGHLTPQQEEALAAYTRGLLNKIAHGPLTEIRRAASQPEGDRILTLIRRMFRLEEP
ncbi:MAG: glutamyl-tRNA reductase [Candidatus Solibacter usitatus]|nr:glutamyl-tRNA reductase [Candidatus Solibacter usitatus]